MKLKNAQFEFLLLNRSPRSSWTSRHITNHVRDPRLGQWKTGSCSFVNMFNLYSLSVFIENKGSPSLILNIAELYTTQNFVAEVFNILVPFPRRWTCCECPARHSLFWHKTPSFVSVTTGNADISYYPSPLSVSDGKRGPPGAHYRSCQMIGAAWRSHGRPNTWSRLPQDVSGRWHGYPLLAWVSFLKEREKGVCGGNEEERRERNTVREKKKLHISEEILEKMHTAFWQEVSLAMIWVYG